MVVPSSVVVPEELELLLELELLDEPELLPELALPLEELLEELPLLLPEELEPPLLPPPPPQAVNIETAMTAARATAAILFDNLMIEFLLFFDSIPKQKAPNVIVWYANLTPPPATLSRESNNFVGFCKNLHFIWCNMTNTHLAGNTKGPPVGRP